ncbi:MAG: serine hydroxymethyltransferase [Candidatus Wildermuthbacteria bacterium RIFCSPLOWO2_02_FULL_47_9c]|uniref:Serine hydroxymethyltransferase n=2 Tax=Parcubacteria group TaxID=1794811 RepID=A0A837ILN5_9BACT|nr:MAG: Serine hydroxymethyltransferase [Candidatus Yanofskybacteria bacterium GW2011_GWC1_48_11]KKW04017.1 MAG: Serine hydroxymethyltransferase [Parcubacteria group bacterium GW2011_GWB1_49_12]KKW08882.1 MAG: Serine hydroxymethyltransferase [Parcubacteria group bacterium GW2011_GWA1_49_26]KKW13736.1 MAG: Serine hydroxymethyltransferase [Parcubacteria group bacterium GW2011_GWA2_50_10]OHA61802.1 MAG: serine hydroxymethyltransferase [Candidatus Wildermuthbacteria bacterium GWA1_49_26]OHA65310.1
MRTLQKQDKEIFDLIKKEEKRQTETIDLIASENYPSKAVREALGSIYVAKYSEGRPYKRYYGGMENVDALEILVEQRVRKAFGIREEWAVNVQPYSGSPANYAVYRGILERGDTILSLDLSHGGHLTHGSPVSLSGTDYRIVHYTVDRKTQQLDYDAIAKLALETRPQLIIAGYSAYSRIIDFAAFGKIAQKVGARLMADTAHITGLIMGKMHPSPFPHADIVTTTTHKTLRGPRGAMIICREELREKIFPKVFPGLQGGPHNHTIAAIGVALKEAMSPAFRAYASQIVKNAKQLAKSLQQLDFQIISGGTDNHVMLVDLRNKDILGKQAQELLESSGIVANRNTIPFDPNPPFNPSGVRFGTPAVTTRGMKEKEMKQIASWISEVISNPASAPRVKKEVASFCKQFPIPD